MLGMAWGWPGRLGKFLYQVCIRNSTILYPGFVSLGLAWLACQAWLVAWRGWLAGRGCRWPGWLGVAWPSWLAELACWLGAALVIL